MRSYPTGFTRVLLTGVAPPDSVLDKWISFYRHSPTVLEVVDLVSPDSLVLDGDLDFIGDRPHKGTEFSGDGCYDQLMGLPFCLESLVAGA